MLAFLHILGALVALAGAQHASDDPEIHPRLTTWECTLRRGCLEKDTAVVLDALTHPVYQVDNPRYTCGEWGSAPNKTVCPDARTCQRNCAMQGIKDYSKLGVTTDGASLRLDMMSEDGDALTPRVYLLSEDESTYEMLSLTGKEFSFDVDVSMLPCGTNGALYLSEMPADGGLSNLNEAGAYYGTGYCDAQCYTTPFIAGEPNLKGHGACCNEMDIWEANSRATLVAPHLCTKPGLFPCKGAGCGAMGACDKAGCAYNPWRLANRASYGRGPRLAVDTTRPFTVISQYPADEDGVLLAYRRLYIQDGQLIDNGRANDTRLPRTDYLSDKLCAATGASRYMDMGGTRGMGEAMSRGMVLAMSIWWDKKTFMQWLDGGDAGPCAKFEGHPKYIRKYYPDSRVTFSNIKWGDIGSTFEDPRRTGSIRFGVWQGA